MFKLTICHANPDDREVIDVIDRGYLHSPEPVYADIREFTVRFPTRTKAVEYLLRYEAEHGEVWASITPEIRTAVPSGDVPF